MEKLTNFGKGLVMEGITEFPWTYEPTTKGAFDRRSELILDPVID